MAKLISTFSLIFLGILMVCAYSESEPINFLTETRVADLRKCVKDLKKSQSMLE